MPIRITTIVNKRPPERPLIFLKIEVLRYGTGKQSLANRPEISRLKGYFFPAPLSPLPCEDPVPSLPCLGSDPF